MNLTSRSNAHAVIWLVDWLLEFIFETYIGKLGEYFESQSWTTRTEVGVGSGEVESSGGGEYGDQRGVSEWISGAWMTGGEWGG